MEGLAGIAIGVITVIHPAATLLVLYSFIAAWAIITGVFEIVAAIRLRKQIAGEWLLGLGGGASLIFGILLLALAAAGILTLIWLIGFYALVFGVVLLVLAFRLRGWRDTVGRQATGAA